VSLLVGPVGLWLAALVCAATALRVRGDRARAPRPPGAVPGPIAWLARMPVPMPVARALARPGDADELRRAGLEGRVTPESLARCRAAGALAGLAVTIPAALLAPVALLLVPLAAVAGALAPGRWVMRRRRARATALVRELPDLLDLLGICVESGMALDPALDLAAGRLGGTVGGEVARVLRDLSLGTPRRAAYQDLIDRTGTPELTRTVAALLQAEELGAPLSGALQGQAEALRAGRRQAARERAATAAPKIQLVVATLMVPAVLLLVIGVLLMELTRQVGAVIG
jgi:tight adherence protein C